MSETQHTPVPWGIERTKHTNWVGPMRSNLAKVKEIVVSLGRDNLIPKALEQSDANSEFICRAVNSHSQLVAALEAAHKFIHSALDLAFCELYPDKAEREEGIKQHVVMVKVEAALRAAREERE
jgi:hypothetical protein